MDKDFLLYTRSVSHLFNPMHPLPWSSYLFGLISHLVLILLLSPTIVGTILSLMILRKVTMIMNKRKSFSCQASYKRKCEARGSGTYKMTAEGLGSGTHKTTAEGGRGGGTYRSEGSGTYKSGGVGTIMLSAPRNHLAVRRETADLRPSLVAALISILNAALYLPTILCWTLIHSRAALLSSTQANDSLIKAAIFLFSLTGCAHVCNFFVYFWFIPSFHNKVSCRPVHFSFSNTASVLN